MANGDFTYTIPDDWGDANADWSGGGGGVDQSGNPWNSGSQGVPQGVQMGNNYMGGLYGTLYNPTSAQMNQGATNEQPFWNLPGTMGGGQGAGDPNPDPGNGGETASDPLGGNWGTQGDSTDISNAGGQGAGSENGSDVNSDNFDAGDMSAGQGYGGAQDGSFSGSVWDLLNSKWGKLGSGVLSMAFPEIGLPLMGARMASGLASGHGGEAVGGALGGFAQGAMGPAGMLLGAVGAGPGAMGAGAGRDFDQGTGMFGDNGGNSQGGGGYSGFGSFGGFGQTNQGGFDPTNLAAGLGSMYLGGKAMSGINGQIGNLNSLYAPNSPYAQQMQQALERQDAASGRRSQYGTRSVELQAALANAASRNAPMLSNLYQQQRMARYGQLASIFQMGRGMFGGQNQQQGGGYNDAAGDNQTVDDVGNLDDLFGG